VVSITGSKPVLVRAPHARLHGNTLLLRAVDRDNPALVWNPVYDFSGAAPAKPGSAAVDPGYAIQLPYDQEEVARAHMLAGNPADISPLVLVTGIAEAELYGIDTRPLLEELAKRTSYPFTVLMLTLLGAGLGIRFKPRETPGKVSMYLTAPLLVALSLAPLHALAGVGTRIAQLFAVLLPREAFLPAWLGFLGLSVVVSLLLSARIAGRTVRS